VSLIDDALKKARAQGTSPSAGEDGPKPEGERRAPDSDPWSYAPMPDRSRPALVIGMVVGLLAVAGIVGVLVLRRDRPSPGANPRPSVSPRAAGSSAPREATPFATVEVAPPPRGLGRSSPEPHLRPPADAQASTAAVGQPRVATAAPVPPSPAVVVLAAPTAAPAQTRIVASAPFPPASSASSASSARAAAPPPSEPLIAEPFASGAPRIASRPSRTSPASSSAAAAPPPPPQASVSLTSPAPSAGDPAPHSSPSSPSASRPDPAPSSRTDISTPARPDAPTPSHAPAQTPLPPARTAVGTFTAPNGARIDLGGIVFSTTPVALINGRVVPVGGMVEGMTVLKIEENRVELSGDGAHVWINLR
jgi:hypothetical protein